MIVLLSLSNHGLPCSVPLIDVLVVDLPSHLSFFGWCVLQDSSSSPKGRVKINNHLTSQGKQNKMALSLTVQNF